MLSELRLFLQNIGCGSAIFESKFSRLPLPFTIFVQSHSMYDLQLTSSVFVLTVNIVCALMLWVLREKNITRSILAAVATVVAVWNLFAVYLMPELRFDRLDFFYEMVGITMAMLVYTYLLSLMSPGANIRKEFKSLIIILAVYFSLYFIIRIVEPRIVIHNYSEIRQNLNRPEVWLRIIAAAHFLVLYGRIIWGFFTMYPRHRKRIVNIYSYRERVSLSAIPFVGILFIIYGFASTLDIFFAEPESVTLIMFNFFFAVIYITVFLLGALQQDVYTPEIIKWLSSAEKEEPGNRKAIPIQSREKLRRDLLRLMETDKVYLNPELRIDTVAQLLNTNRTYISTVINEDLGQSFIVFVNNYRIQEAQRLMQEGGLDKSIAEISELVGFKSHSSFIEFFKRFSGMSPGEFKRQG